MAEAEEAESECRRDREVLVFPADLEGPKPLVLEDVGSVFAERLKDLVCSFVA